MSNKISSLAAAWLLLGSISPDLRAASSTVFRSGPYIIDAWDAEDGLQGNSVIAMTQTRDGYLWLGTLYGLVRFDGIRFTVFDENNTPGLNSSRIVKLFEDSQDNLWIGTETAGIAVMKNGAVTSPPELGSSGAERRLLAACEDSKGAVWLYNKNGDLWRYWNKGFRPFLQAQYGSSDCRAIIAEAGGPVWVGTDYRQSAIGPIVADGSLELPVEQVLPAGKLDALWASRQGGYWRLADGRVQKWSTNRLERDWGPYRWNPRLTAVTAMCEDREGNLVVGTLGAGIFWYNAEGQATTLSTDQGLASNYILSLFVDREGALWVGTDGSGLNRVKRQVFDVLEECRGWVVQSVCEDDQGGLWIGSNGGEVGFWKDGVLQRFGPGQGLPNFSVKAVLADRHRQVWVGTHAPRGGGTGLFQWQNNRFQRVAVAEGAPQVVQALHQDKDGQLWLGTDGGLMRWDEHEWKIFTMRDGLSSDVVRALADDREGNLWVGTVGGGLNRWRDGQFTAYRKKDGLPSDDISSLWVDDAGVLWVGTVGSGLAGLYNGKWVRYSTREGLISNAIDYLMDDDQGDLWIGSNVGLMRLSKKTLSAFARGLTNFVPCRAYGKSDGLPKAECTSGSQPAGCRARDGTLWFPTIKGLVSLNPAHLQTNTNPPPVVIESVLIEGEAQETNSLRSNFAEGVTVPADKERVEIHYTSLNLAAPDRARFKYQLENHEAAWTEAGNIRVARYSKLPPGHYRFHVTACNEDGVWNEKGSSLALSVEPPFWRTWWFISATAVALLGMITAVVHYLSTQRLQRQLEHLRQQEALEKERARIARDIHDQVGASLTQVSLLGELVESDKDSPDEVQGHARQIAQTARETTRALDEIVWTVNPSNDTLDGLITYVCKYAQEYLAVAGLRYRLDVPAQLPSTAISPEVRHNVFLASKEAVTNVVRHAQASEVWVRLKSDAAAFTLEIEDNGRGVAVLDQTKAQSRNGLRNMSKRMEDIGGRFELGPGPGGGTRVRLTVPLARN